MSELLERLAAIFFPPPCVFCGEVVEYGADLCPECRLPVAEDGFRKGNPYFQRAFYPLYYRERAAEAIVLLKEHPDRRLAAFFARLMAEKYRGQCPAAMPDILVPVPLRKEEDGRKRYNHAALLAQELSRQLRVPVREGLLYRSPDSLAQHTLSAEERARNAACSYHSAKEYTLQGERVLLVDDVITTGSTAGACAKCLLELGASVVEVVTAAGTAFPS